MQGIPELLGSLYAVVLIFLMIFWPLIVLYLAWRMLRAVERIANATERTAQQQTAQTRAIESVAPLTSSGERSGISLSAFGR
jgi:hypothetical protein